MHSSGVGGSGTGNPTYSLEPEDRGSDCWQGQPKRDFAADVNADANCERTSIALSCLTRNMLLIRSATTVPGVRTATRSSGILPGIAGSLIRIRPGGIPGLVRVRRQRGRLRLLPDSTLWGCETKQCSR